MCTCLKWVTWVACWLVMAACPALAEPLDREALAPKVEPPYELGESLGQGVWSITDRTGVPGGYVFQTGPLAPLPGFSGEVIDVLVTLDLEGRFLRAELLAHNEPVFVSGLGEAPFHEFMRQYRGPVDLRLRSLSAYPTAPVIGRRLGVMSISTA